MDRSTFDHSKSGDTNPKGRWRSWLQEPYTRSLPSGREEKSRPPSFCRLRRQTALWYTLDEDQGTEREVRNCPPKRVRSRTREDMAGSGTQDQAVSCQRRPITLSAHTRGTRALVSGVAGSRGTHGALQGKYG